MPPCTTHRCLSSQSFCSQLEVECAPACVDCLTGFYHAIGVAVHDWGCVGWVGFSPKSAHTTCQCPKGSSRTFSGSVRLVTGPSWHHTPVPPSEKIRLDPYRKSDVLRCAMCSHAALHVPRTFSDRIICWLSGCHWRMRRRRTCGLQDRVGILAEWC